MGWPSSVVCGAVLIVGDCLGNCPGSCDDAIWHCSNMGCCEEFYNPQKLMLFVTLPSTLQCIFLKDSISIKLKDKIILREIHYSIIIMGIMVGDKVF